MNGLCPLPERQVTLMVASDIPGVLRMVSKFPYCSARSPLRLSKASFTWRARNFLGLYASLFIPWSHSTAACWPPGIARELGQSIYFLPNTHPYIHQQRCWKQEGFPLTDCIHLTTQRPLHNRWENREGQSRWKSLWTPCCHSDESRWEQTGEYNQVPDSWPVDKKRKWLLKPKYIKWAIWGLFHVTATYAGVMQSFQTPAKTSWLEKQMTVCGQNVVFPRSLSELVSLQYHVWLGAALRIT